MKEKHIYNGVELSPPNNYDAVGYEVIFDKSGNANSQTTVDLEFGLAERSDTFETLMQWIQTSITQGLPYRVEIDSQLGKKFTIFDGHINLWGAKINKEHTRIEATALETNGLGWLAEHGDAITFDYLKEKGYIKESDYIDIPYLINRVGRNHETFLAIMTAFVVTVEINRVIQNDLPGIVARLAGMFTTVPAFLEAAALIIYLTFLFISLTSLIIQIFDLIISRVKYHKGMKAIDLIKAGCDYFGLKFQSSIFANQTIAKLVILPEKYTLYESPVRNLLGRVKVSDESKGGFYRGTFGQFIEAMRTLFYAKIIIQNGVMYFEKNNFRKGAPAYTIPKLAGEYQTYKHNVEDFRSTFILEFTADSDDRNVIQKYKGTSVQINTRPNVVFSQRHNLAKNFETVTIPFALARRKEKLNVTEVILQAFLKTIQFGVNAVIFAINLVGDYIDLLTEGLNAIIKALNFILPSGKKLPLVKKPNLHLETIKMEAISNRRDYLVMEEDFVSVPKIMLLEKSGKLAKENEAVLNARYLWENFHYFRGFAKGNNQWKTFELPRVQLSYQDVANLRETNFCLTADGLEAEVLSMKLNPSLQVVEGEYRVRERYIDNLITEIIEPE